MPKRQGTVLGHGHASDYRPRSRSRVSTPLLFGLTVPASSSCDETDSQLADWLHPGSCFRLRCPRRQNFEPAQECFVARDLSKQSGSLSKAFLKDYRILGSTSDHLRKHLLHPRAILPFARVLSGTVGKRYLSAWYANYELSDVLRDFCAQQRALGVPDAVLDQILFLRENQWPGSRVEVVFCVSPFLGPTISGEGRQSYPMMTLNIRPSTLNSMNPGSYAPRV